MDLTKNKSLYLTFEQIQEVQQRIYDRMLATHFARDKLLGGSALEDNATNNQKFLQKNVTDSKTNANFDKASVGSHLSELPEIAKSGDNGNVDPLHILK
jgi:hypothetical protein